MKISARNGRQCSATIGRLYSKSGCIAWATLHSPDTTLSTAIYPFSRRNRWWTRRRDKSDSESQALFDALRQQILALGADVIELCGAKSVTYRVFDFFVEVMPRKRRLLLLLNLDFENCDDPSGIASDATEWAFITNASEDG